MDPTIRQENPTTMRSALRFFWGQFLTGFCFHLILPFVLLLLAGSILGWIGGAFGTVHLFLHEDALKQGVVGFSVFLLAWNVLLAGYLLQTRRTKHAERPRLFSCGPALTYLIGIVLSSALLLGVVGLFRVLVRGTLYHPHEDSPFLLNPPEDDWDTPHQGIPFALGALAAIAVAVQFTTLHWMQPRLMPMMRALGRLTHRLLRTEADPDDFYLHGVATVSWAVSFLFFLACGLLPDSFSPAVGLCSLLNGLVAGYAFFAYFMPRVGAVVLFLLMFLVWLGGLPRFKYRVPGLERHYDAPVPLADIDLLAAEPPLLHFRDIDFTRSRHGRHSARHKRPLVVVCAAGGGLRSAAWTYSVLRELDESLARENVDFPHHLRLVTGSSGGMLGASCWILNLPEARADRPPMDADDLYDRMTRDSLSPVIQRLTYGDLWSGLSPFPLGGDRGRELERTWSRNLDGLLDRTFLEVREGELNARLPSLLFSPMMVEDGRRLLIGNLGAADKFSPRAWQLNPDPAEGPMWEPDLSEGAVDLFSLFPERKTREAFKVSTAVRMSASFPYITPAVPLPTIPRRRVVDAGYFDDFGVDAAANVLAGDDVVAWLADHVSGVLIVQIRDGRSDAVRFLRKGAKDDSKPSARGLEELTSPAEGLFNVRDRSAVYRNDEHLALLSKYLSMRIEKNANGRYCTLATFEYGGKASLSWYLTPREREHLRDEARTNLGPRIARIVEWWKSRPNDLVP